MSYLRPVLTAEQQRRLAEQRREQLEEASRRAIAQAIEDSASYLSDTESEGDVEPPSASDTEPKSDEPTQSAAAPASVFANPFADSDEIKRLDNLKLQLSDIKEKVNKLVIYKRNDVNVILRSHQYQPSDLEIARNFEMYYASFEFTSQLADKLLEIAMKYIPFQTYQSVENGLEALQEFIVRIEKLVAKSTKLHQSITHAVFPFIIGDDAAAERRLRDLPVAVAAALLRTFVIPLLENGANLLSDLESDRIFMLRQIAIGNLRSQAQTELSEVLVNTATQDIERIVANFGAKVNADIEAMNQKVAQEAKVDIKHQQDMMVDLVIYVKDNVSKLEATKTMPNLIEFVRASILLPVEEEVEREGNKPLNVALLYKSLDNFNNVMSKIGTVTKESDKPPAAAAAAAATVPEELVTEEPFRPVTPVAKESDTQVEDPIIEESSETSSEGDGSSSVGTDRESDYGDTRQWFEEGDIEEEPTAEEEEEHALSSPDRSAITPKRSFERLFALPTPDIFEPSPVESESEYVATSSPRESIPQEQEEEEVGEEDEAEEEDEAKEEEAVGALVLEKPIEEGTTLTLGDVYSMGGYSSVQTLEKQIDLMGDYRYDSEELRSTPIVIEQMTPDERKGVLVFTRLNDKFEKVEQRIIPTRSPTYTAKLLQDLKAEAEVDLARDDKGTVIITHFNHRFEKVDQRIIRASPQAPTAVQLKDLTSDIQKRLSQHLLSIEAAAAGELQQDADGVVHITLLNDKFEEVEEQIIKISHPAPTALQLEALEWDMKKTQLKRQLRNVKTAAEAKLMKARYQLSTHPDHLRAVPTIIKRVDEETIKAVRPAPIVAQLEMAEREMQKHKVKNQLHNISAVAEQLALKERHSKNIETERERLAQEELRKERASQPKQPKRPTEAELNPLSASGHSYEEYSEALADAVYSRRDDNRRFGPGRYMRYPTAGF